MTLPTDADGFDTGQTEDTGYSYEFNVTAPGGVLVNVDASR